ncbi:Serine/threonine-protein kinase plk1 [Entomophthora muscae]|uniref:Serine/threonine-protein kinase plk1 n=1 Tax=Entomophthora muscae TaxID=34485 RepID=A0ACC2SYU4_9FUNG|nr:Serine/threonine-protein kinase plk1 [Entomophthora muscae]
MKALHLRIPKTDKRASSSNPKYVRCCLMRKEMYLFTLAKGGFATCYEASCSISGKQLCCKTIWKAKLHSDYDKLRVRSKKSIHLSMKHPNVVRFYSALEDGDFIYFIMDICTHGTLKDLLFYCKTLTEPEVQFYMLQLLSAVEYFMKRNVIHRDLKLANIFVAEDMTLRIGDIGLAAKLEAGQSCCSTICGTPNYTAPEVLYQDGHSYGVDMWALGIIMYALLIGTPPFQGSSNLEETYFVEEQPDFNQVRNHPFFQGFTPTLLSKDTLRHPPRFAGDSNSALKRGLDADRFAYSSPIPGPSTPPKRARFMTAYNPNSPPPPQKTYCFKELMGEDKCTPTPRAVLPEPLSTECPAEHSDAHDVYTEVKGLIALGRTKPQIEVIIGEADLTIPNFILKRVFHGKDHVQAYEFLDGTTGVLFPDLSTLILSPDKVRFEYIETQGNQPLATCYTHAEFQKGYPHMLVDFDHMVKELGITPPAINDNVKCDFLPTSLQMSATIPVATSGAPTLPYLFKVNEASCGTFLRLSNNSIQMNLNRGHLFVLSDNGCCVVAIPQKECSLSALYGRASYFLNTISFVAQYKHTHLYQKPLSSSRLKSPQP